MKVLKKVLTDAFVLSPSVRKDSRGYFYESYNQNSLNRLLETNYNFLQDNQSSSALGTLRGIHFQTGEFAQAKLVRVVKGKAFDVAVDLRPGSPSFKQCYGIELSSENHLQFLIPRGFGHGFVALEENTVLQYKVDNYYSSQHDNGIIWNDDTLGIHWPTRRLNMSQKDQNLKSFSSFDFFKVWNEEG